MRPNTKRINLGIINLGVDFNLYKEVYECVLKYENNERSVNVLDVLSCSSESEIEIVNHAIILSADFLVVLYSDRDEDLDVSKLEYRSRTLEWIKYAKEINNLEVCGFLFSSFDQNVYNHQSDPIYRVSDLFHANYGCNLEERVIDEVWDDLNRYIKNFEENSTDEIAEKRILNCLEKKMTYLDLSNLGLKRLPSAIVILKDTLEYVCIGNHQYFPYVDGFAFSCEDRYGQNDIDDVSILSEFNNLKAIYGSRNRLSFGLHSMPVQILEQLIHLDLYDSNVLSYSFLNSCKNLIMLDVSFTSISTEDLKSLAQMEALEDLSLEHISTRSIKTALKVLKSSNLKQLNISNTNFQNIEELADLQNLEVLKIAGNKLTKLDGLSSHRITSPSLTERSSHNTSIFFLSEANLISSKSTYGVFSVFTYFL